MPDLNLDQIYPPDFLLWLQVLPNIAWPLSPVRFCSFFFAEGDVTPWYIIVQECRLWAVICVLWAWVQDFGSACTSPKKQRSKNKHGRLAVPGSRHSLRSTTLWTKTNTSVHSVSTRRPLCPGTLRCLCSIREPRHTFSLHPLRLEQLKSIFSSLSQEYLNWKRLLSSFQHIFVCLCK